VIRIDSLVHDSWRKCPNGREQNSCRPRRERTKIRSLANLKIFAIAHDKIAAGVDRRLLGLIVGTRGQVLISPDCVFDASLVRETCLDTFVDLKGLTSTFLESRVTGHVR
jgi:hypothetical protein